MESKTSNQTKFSNKKFRLADKIVIILCLSGTIVSLGLFWNDLYRTVRNQNSIQLGIISFKYNTAQRRLGDRVLWDRLRRNSPIYDGDTIRTADLSEATIRFPGGMEINISENTLILIRMKDGQAVVDLADGELNLGGDATGTQDTIILNVGDNQIEASGDAVLSASTGRRGQTIQVARGNAVLSNATGQRRTATAGSVVSLAGSDPNRPQAHVTAPQSNARYITRRQSPVTVNFRWNRVNIPANEALRLEFSRTRNFTNISQTISSAGTQARVNLEPGTWQWRIMRNTGSTVLAQGRVTVIYAPAPTLISPAQGYTIQYRAKMPSVRFQWNEVEGVSSYKIEVAGNSSFNNPVINTSTRNTYINTSLLDAGTWHWRVTPIFTGEVQGNVVSSSASFRIQQTSRLPAPTLIAPAAGSTVNVIANRGTYFSWKKEDEAATYTIIISEHRNLRDPIVNRVVKDNYFNYQQKIENVKPGQYYWAVFQTDIAGEDSPHSSVNSFNAIVNSQPPRPLFPPNNYIVSESQLPDIRFTWKSEVRFTGQFQVSGTSNFAQTIIDEKVSGESFRTRALPPGNYYWRVINNFVEPALQSPSQRFSVLATLPAPVVNAPRPGENIAVRGDPLALRWRAVNNAEYYSVRVFAGTSASRRPLIEQKVRGTSLEISADAFSTGPYFWTIQALVDEKATSSSLKGNIAENQFSVRRLFPITLLSPETDEEVTGPAILKWDTPERIGNSRFLISRNANPLSGRPVQEIRNPDKTITIERLSQGVYYWTIVAESADGYDISALTPRRFRSLPLLLDEPLNRLPQDGFVFGPDALRVNRAITFSWEPVEDADAYIFILFRDTGTQKQQIVKTEPQQELSWVLQDIQLINEGEFVWQLEAVRLTERGTILQRGHVAENSFRLEVPMPDQVQTLEAGTLYGK